MWLRDSLPTDISGARILTYGYDSHLVDSESFQDLEALGRTLCSSLQAIGTTRRLVPKIFIGHSLGGLVIKQAIVLMKNWNDARSTILYQTYGMMFLGVPNQGMKIERLRPLVEGQPNEQLLYSLGTESQLLRNQTEQFAKAFSFEDSEIVCFYETVRSPTTMKVGSHAKKVDLVLSNY
jgi:hypothetical protein